MEDQTRIAIGLRPKNIHQVSINLYDQYRPLSGADIKISNVKITEDIEDEDHDVANEKVNSWRYNLAETNKLPGNYTFLAEPGTYYIRISLPDYVAEYHTIKVQKGENVFDFQMTQKIMAKISFCTINMFDSKPVEQVELLIYDRGGHLLETGRTNANGIYETKIELASTFKIYTKKEPFVDMYQEYLATTTAIMDVVLIRLIPKNKDPEGKFEIIAAYPEETYNVALHAICPDHTIINQKNLACPAFHIRYDELVVGPTAVNIITYEPKKEGDKGFPAWDFEIIMTLNHASYFEPNRIVNALSHNGEFSLTHDHSQANSRLSTPATRRVSAASYFLNSKLSPKATPNKSPVTPSRRTVNTSSVEKSILKSTYEDTKNYIDLNNCLRIYILYKNVLQDVLYCCSKNLKNKIWRIGVISTLDESFHKINVPDMKNVFRTSEKDLIAETNETVNASKIDGQGNPNSVKKSPRLSKITENMGEKADKVSNFIHKKENSFGKFFDGINQQEKNEIENYMQEFIE